MVRFNKEAIDLSHFRIETSIGKGGFGKVNCVTQLRSNNLFAMKTLNKAKCFNATAGVKQVFSELYMLSELHHPMLCNAHYAFQDADNLYLVMDLALGGDLKYQITANKCLTEEHSRFVAASMVLAIKYLHDNEVVHRDIKPANILMKTDGHLMLTDFGLASKIDQLDPREVCGTDGYIPPETYQGKHMANTNTIKSGDWFALGVTLHMCVTGDRPFTTGKRLADNMDKYNEVIKDLKDTTQVGSECQDLIRQLLHPHMNHRLGTDGGAQVIMDHPFFAGFDWEALLSAEMVAPFLPDTTKKNVDRRMSLMDLEEQLVGFNAYQPRMQKDNQHHFASYKLNTHLTPEDESYILRRSKCCVVM